jgi:hypothetical protein
MKVLEEIAGTAVSVRPYADGQGQDILVQATPVGERLALFLASIDGGGEPAMEQYPEGAHAQPVYVIPHSRRLDEHVKELVDVLILLRWEHPRLMQLSLSLPVLSEAEGPVLSEAEGPVLSEAEGPVLSEAEGPGMEAPA